MAIKAEGNGGGLWTIEGTDAILYIGGTKVAKIDSNGTLHIKSVKQVRTI